MPFLPKQPGVVIAPVIFCVGYLTMGYFSGRLLWHVELIADDKECGSQMTNVGSHTHMVSEKNNTASRKTRL